MCYLQPNHIFHFLIKKTKNLKGIMVSKIISNYRIWLIVYFIKPQQQIFNLILQRDPCISLMRRWLFPMGWCTLQQCTCVNGFKSWPYSRIERGELKFHLGFESSIGQKSTKALPKSLNTEIGYMIYIKCMQLISVLRNKKL